MKPLAPLNTKELQKLHQKPRDYVLNAHAPCLDKTAQQFIAASSMLLIASINQDGDIDISPRGGPPGFVTILDNNHIAFVSEMGNNKLLTLSNVQKSSRIGLMFIVPGVTDILRLYGYATATHDEDFILSLGGNLKRNKTAVRIEITKVFPHCSTALNRAGFWKQEMWPDKNEYKIPTLKEMAEGLAGCREDIEENDVLNKEKGN